LLALINRDKKKDAPSPLQHDLPPFHWPISGTFDLENIAKFPRNVTSAYAHKLASTARMGVLTLHHQFRTLRDESAAVSKAIAATNGVAADADGRIRRYDGRIGSGL
jgi:hypothetical protein